MTTRAFFEEVVDVLRGFLASEHQDFESRVGSRNVKIWFGSDGHEHYEAQLLPGSRGLEVGFHAEHSDAARNEDVLSRLLSKEREWRREIGDNAEAGPFLGRQAPMWRRISEIWDDPELGADGAADVADRLDCYIRALEPFR